MILLFVVQFLKKSVSKELVTYYILNFLVFLNFVIDFLFTFLQRL